MPLAKAGATLKPLFRVRAVSKRPIGSFIAYPFLNIFSVVFEGAYQEPIWFTFFKKRLVRTLINDPTIGHKENLVSQCNC
jgi:hypothetical protein